MLLKIVLIFVLLISLHQGLGCHCIEEEEIKDLEQKCL